MKNVHDEKEKLMNELFGKSKAYDINDTLNTLNSIENELNNLIAKNNNDIKDMPSFDVDDLKTQMEKDLDVKLDVPEKVVLGKASKEVFDKIKINLKESTIGQDEAIDKLVNGFNRPYITGSDARLIRNTIYLYGPKGSGRHYLVNNMAEQLKKNGLTV